MKNTDFPFLISPFSFSVRRAFTLVELLIVIIIITMLAAMTLVASHSALQASKETKTRMTVIKLDTAMRRIFENYAERFDNILNCLSLEDKTAAESLSTEEKTKLKLHLIHELMRFELPEKLSDIETEQQAIHLGEGDAAKDYKLNAKPPVQPFYQDACSGKTDVTSAELLFLIIQNLSPESLSAFKGSEVGDTDNNGLYEFLDAWGHPIHFFRNAPGFTGSDLQPDIVKKSGTALSITGNPAKWADMVAASAAAVRSWGDYFDSENVLQRTWFLYPVIVSAGPDGKLDLWRDTADTAVPSGNQAFTPFDSANGIPEDNDNDGSLNHYDNIHNHRSQNSY
ncbi:MAG: prepilin-type N-terminal cleavage/methylation domain-containing protein [Planctomycetaceae bacterium]|nr:prepilin-type N-terminal cleavage/methylation domain-containing protein [Planctomycetaceae bacterium]